MKRKNFPARKLARQVWAQERRELTDSEYQEARAKRTKKRRAD